MTYRSHLRHALVAVGLVIAVAACVDTPASPEATPSSRPTLAQSTEEKLLVPATLSPIARYIKKPHAQDYWIKQWIGPNGGVVDFLGFRIIVPAGAVTRVTKFEIRIPGENDPSGQDHAWAEFGPHNVNFRVPVRIELPYANTTAFGAESGVMWYNRRSRQWEAVGGGITADGQRVYMDVNHFSEYGTCGATQLCSFDGGTGTGSGGRATY